MSDLHDAVQAEIAAHQPDRTPPFELLEQRKSAQDRRHRAVAAALAGAAVTAVALAPSYVFDRGRDAPTSAAPVSRTSPPTTSSCAGDVTVTKQTGVPLTLVVPYRQEVDLALQVGDSLRVSGSGPCGSSIRPVLQGTGPLVQGSSQRFVVASSPGAASLQLTQPMCGLPPDPRCAGGLVLLGTVNITIRAAAPSPPGCYGGEATDALEPAAVGLSEAEARARYTIRVISRDGTCAIAISADLHPDRLNIAVDQGTVIWAGRV